jgi:hypothetical protein
MGSSNCGQIRLLNAPCWCVCFPRFDPSPVVFGEKEECLLSLFGVSLIFG